MIPFAPVGSRLTFKSSSSSSSKSPSLSFPSRTLSHSTLCLSIVLFTSLWALGSGRLPRHDSSLTDRVGLEMESKKKERKKGYVFIKIYNMCYAPLLKRSTKQHVNQWIYINECFCDEMMTSFVSRRSLHCIGFFFFFFLNVREVSGSS